MLACKIPSSAGISKYTGGNLNEQSTKGLSTCSADDAGSKEVANYVSGKLSNKELQKIAAREYVLNS